MGTVISISPAVKKVKPIALDTLAEKAWEISINDPDKAIKLNRELLELSEETDYKKGKALAYRNISFINLKHFNAKQSLDELQKALDIFKEIKYEDGIADCYRIFGLSLAATNNYADALVNYLNAYEIYTLQDNIVGSTLVLDDIGQVYFELGAPTAALYYFTEALNQVNQLSEQFIIKAELHSHIGFIYTRFNHFKQALFHLNESCKITGKLKYQQVHAENLQHLGELKFKEGEFKEALKFYSHALKIWKQLDDSRKTADSYYNIGIAKFTMNKYNEAGASFLKALALYEKSGDKNQTLDTELQISWVKIKNNRLTDAEKILNKALLKSVQIGDIYSECKAHEFYADYFERIDKADKVLFHTRKALVLNALVKKTEEEEFAHNVEIILNSEKRRRQLDENKLHDLYHSKKNKALNEVIQVRKEILRYASHDLKSPLNSIKGLVNLLSNSFNTKKQVKEYTSLIEEAADQMLKLVNDIQHASLAESGFVECKPVLFDLVAQAKLCANSFLVQAQEKNQTIIVKSTKPHYVYADNENMSSVLTNLISNASKFSYLNQRITISFSTVKGLTRCIVKDQGQGLTRTDLKDAFQQFKKLSARPTGSEESIGLGLFICKKLVEANKGKIWVESEGKNKGSRFIFELPNKIEMNEN